MANKLKILIVEDEYIIREVLQSQLSAYGKCSIAVDGEEAVIAISKSLEEGETPYDLICMDIMMSGIDGIKASAKIRQLEKEHAVLPINEVKIIMVTALQDPKTVKQSLYDSGADGFIVKPVDPGKLKKEIMNLGLI